MERIHVASHSTRIRILDRLLGGNNYAAKLGQELNIERKVIAFHIGELEKVGLVEGKFTLNQDKKTGSCKILQDDAHDHMTHNAATILSKWCWIHSSI